MKYLLVILVLATVFIQQVLCEEDKEQKKKELKCPTGFELFHRTPTDRNNFTSLWCLGIVRHNETYDHDVALSVCARWGLDLSTIENYYEWRKFSDIIHKEFNEEKLEKTNNTIYLSIDGFFNPHCKDFSDRRFRKHGGDCELETNIVLFQDVNTDPRFMLTQMATEVPYGIDTLHHELEISFNRDKRSVSECFAINARPSEGRNIHNHFCHQLPNVNFIGALCGTKPDLV